MTFNGKYKATSQFFFNLKEDGELKVADKLRKTIEEYFEYYSQFQNITPIKEVEAYSIDFKCSNRCAIKVSNKMTVINLIFSLKTLQIELESAAKKFQIELDPRLLKR